MNASKNYSALLISALLWPAHCPAQAATLVECDRQLFRGFDSRLKATAVDAVPRGELAVALAVLDGNPVLAYPQRLVLFPASGPSAVLTVPQPVRSLLSDGRSLRLVTTTGLLAFGEHGFAAEAATRWMSGNSMAQQDTRSTLLAHDTPSQVEFSARQPSGATVPMFAIRGRSDLVSWTSAGLAAVVGDSLYTFAKGASTLQAAAQDTSFSSARDLCMVGPARAVVVFPHTTVLYSHGTRTILTQMTGRCAWSQKVLYLFDQDRGGLWKLEGLDDVGDAAHTAAFLKTLASRAHASDAEGALAFRELARFIGYDAAAGATGRTDPCK